MVFLTSLTRVASSLALLKRVGSHRELLLPSRPHNVGKATGLTIELLRKSSDSTDPDCPEIDGDGGGTHQQKTKPVGSL